MKGKYMEIEHLKIEYNGDKTYIVNNTFNNRYIKLGVREVKYLLEKLNRETNLQENMDLPPLSEEQKSVLDSKFHEWGFFEKSKKKEKRELSNLVIFELKPDTFIYKIIKLFQYIISPIGVSLIVATTVLAYISIGLSSNRIMDGVYDIHISIGTIIIIYIINFICACIHEFCHEAACYKYTRKIGRLGIKLFYMMPAFFCDVSNMYMTSSKKKCFYISAAGLMSNVVIANLSIIIFDHAGGSSNLFLLIYFINVCNIALNLIPFAKYDGYWIVKSLTGIDNLYDKSVSLLYMLILSCRGYCGLKISIFRKILMTLYGMVIYAFHWLLWILSIYTIHDLIHWKSVYLQYGVILMFAALGLSSCISYTRKYFRNYKKYLYTEG